ncbi:divergent AAA domain protein [Prevotella denticola CRIS 18C-A]|uniref:Divergent AAA domain protein n=1 Tax=Prevotella denticola CRIS 18C-A TaxID=944557 RepID=F0H9D8_9BACT|nr:RNA-binding domain-containing protein [Prevotella denticola]AXV48722.1 ATP-dependent DNA helicase RecG [Prevotella denticola]EGC85538.1 divergent AAA domain protein [Prevotella denticola CRIS 18C-A]
MDAKELKTIISLGENSRVEFKEHFSKDIAIADEIVAFANSKGGYLIFGIEDKTGNVKGLSYEEIQKISSQVGNTANENIRPTLYVESETVAIEGKKLLVIHIKEGISKPYKDISGNIFVKQGADKRRITENNELLELFYESGTYHPDEEGVKNTSIADLDKWLVDKYLMEVFHKKASDFGLPFEALMRNMQITTLDGRLTLAGLLYFGNMPQMFCPEMVVKAVSFYGNNIGSVNYRDSRDIDGTIPRLFSEGMSFLKSNLHALQDGQNFNSVGHLEISEIALEEVLQNALVHRDYLKPAAVRLLIFDNRVEIISPGKLPGGMDVDDIKLGNSFIRNRLMASFCAKTMLYRGLGSGIIRAMNEYPKIDFINDESGNQFKCVLYRPVPYEMPNMVSEPVMEYGRPSGHTPSIERYCPTLPKEETERAEKILRLCVTPKSILNMMDATGYKSRTSFRRRILTHLLDAHLLEPTDKKSPNSPRQTYITTSLY